MDISPVVIKSLGNFPGPITFVESPAKWWLITPAALLIAAGLLFLVVRDFHQPHVRVLIFLKMVRGIVGATFFGFAAAFGATIILSPPSLRLDESGFTFTTLFRSRVFTWDQVSDFSTSSTQGSALVVFTATRRYLGMMEKFYGGPIAGRNGYLPNSYGFSARDLSQLMTMWQRMASRPRAANVHSATSPPCESPP